MSHGGKGDKPRPFNVPKEEFDKSFETIFGKYVPPYLRNKIEEADIDPDYPDGKPLDSTQGG